MGQFWDNENLVPYGTAVPYISHEVAPVVRAEVEPNLPQEMGVLPDGHGIRPGRRDKDRVVEQIERAYADERINEDQRDARIAGVLAAERRSDFRHITRDLPPGPASPRDGVVKSNPGTLLAIGIFWLCFGGAILGADISSVNAHSGWAVWFIGVLSYLMVIIGAAQTTHAGRRIAKE